MGCLDRLFEAGVLDKNNPAHAAVVVDWEEKLGNLIIFKGEAEVARAVETIIAMWRQGRLKSLRAPDRLVMRILQQQDFQVATNPPPADTPSVEHESDGGLNRGRRL